MLSRWELYALYVSMKVDVHRESARAEIIAGIMEYLIQRGVKPEFGTMLLEAYNEVRCQPPLTKEELIASMEMLATRRENARREARRARRQACYG